MKQTRQTLRRKITKKITSQYWLALPAGYAQQPKKKWPLLLFLHGAGERGDNLAAVKVHGPLKLVDQGRKFPFIVVAPQCPANDWWRPDGLAALLDEIERRYRVDQQRVYVTGLTGKGVVYPFVEYVPGADSDRRICLLSRFPIVARHSRTDYTYRLNDRATPISRGILDVALQIADHYSFRAIVVHLKSKRAVEFGDQSEMRLEEAKLLRAHLADIFQRDPETKLLALGDFNDTPETTPIKTVMGPAPFALFALPCQTSRGYTGTHLWRFHSEWSRLDYLLASRALSNDFVAGSAQIYEGPDAGVASDHRLIYASFRTPTVGSAPLAGHPTRRLGLTTILLVLVLVAGGIAIVIARRELLDPKP